MEANFNLKTPKYILANRLGMAFQEELSRKAIAEGYFSLLLKKPLY